MYADFYGLKERPFALLPDPRFLYLSRSHREALAHMLYGIDSGEGFIEVVGQVGTGKTTLCRTLLGRLGADTEIAYIFNPSPSESQLLAAINREFGLPTVGRSRAEWIEQLNRFLLEKRSRDRRALLVIDEAQVMEPAVLEQIRLLSNLETEQEKLLQIVLIGQPELEENLARPDLRQLRQRITVRWTLRALDRGEVGEYVRHRLRVAGLENPDLFSRGALRALYRASRGIPRVINAIADRSLLAGYSKGRRSISARTIRRAARELPASETQWPSRGMASASVGATVICGLLLGFFATVWWPQLFTRRPVTPPVSSGAQLSSLIGGVGESRAESPGSESLGGHLLQQGPRVTAAGALEALLARWGYHTAIGSEVDPNSIAATVRELSPLRVFVTRADLEQLALVNLPVIVELEPGSEQKRYAALLSLEPDGAANLGLRDRVFTLAPGEIERWWTGRAFFLWSNFESMPAMAHGMTGTAVRWLQARLTDLGYLRRGDASGDFDDYTVSAIRQFQSEHGLRDTGRVGPETLIALYQRLDYGTPTLVNDGGAS